MRLKIREAILVEGYYDMALLRKYVDAPVFECRGFHIFKDKEMLSLLRHTAKKRGLIILTDSDSAGFVIRNHISGIVPPEQLKNAYIPQIKGVEKRKKQSSGEGLLGVEGMNGQVVIEALRRCGATFEGETAGESGGITMHDLYESGLTGAVRSAKKRAALLTTLGFPPEMTAGRLLKVLNSAFTREMFFELLESESIHGTQT